MKKTLLGIVTLVALAIGVNSYAACPCDPCEKPCDPCAKACEPCEKPCEPCNPCKSCEPCDPCACTTGCGEDWLCSSSLQEYFCQMGFTECQKQEAMNAIEEFKCKTECIRANDCKCETKCDCRTYRKALRDLDCQMKQIITKCQKDEYKDVKKAVKDQVKCAHKCLINPFNSCKCSCK